MKKFLCILSLSFLICINAKAACIEGDCQNGQGTFDDGKKIYTGQFKGGKYNGQGSLVGHKSGSKYVGEWKDNKRHGQGTFAWKDGRKLVGEWKDGLPNGQGTYTFPNGDEYVGEYKDGKRNGQGTFTWTDLRKYVGEWKDGKKNGQGTFTFPSGNKYVGEFKDDKFNGQGTFTWKDGRKYVGEWKDDKRQGQGTYAWVSGAKYVGEWKDNKYNGEGIYTYPDGTVKKGPWINGKTKKSVDARNKKQFKPYAVCIGANKKYQINTLINLFQSNNNPAAISFMLDAGCNNSWSTPIRGIDLEEFSRNGRFVGVKTKEIMGGNGWIYAIVSADEWDSN